MPYSCVLLTTSTSHFTTAVISIDKSAVLLPDVEIGVHPYMVLSLSSRTDRLYLTLPYSMFGMFRHDKIQHMILLFGFCLVVAEC